MARENQALHIVLILCIMLIVVLGVCTYVGFHNASETALKAKSNAADASAKAVQLQTAQDNLKTLEGMIGLVPTDDIKDVTDKFNEDMQKYGQSYPEQTRKYRLLLEKMLKTIEERTADLEAAKKQIKDLDEQYAVRESSKDSQIKQFQDASVKANDERAAESAKFKTEVARKNEEGAKLAADLKSARLEADQKVAKVESALDVEKKKVEKQKVVIETQADKIANYESGQIKAPDGEVLWANQREGTVWINLGRADNLTRQVTFSVYPGDNSNLTVKDKKGSIEVTHIIGEHLAEARVLDDVMSNPIIPGDRIHTVLWSANAKRHFAIAGMVDLNGDGTSDLDTLINIIQLNGGVVDCYISDKGSNKNQVVGAITPNTNALILGDAPTERGDPAMLAAFTKIQNEADLLRTPKIQLGDLLQGMGWKDLSHVVRYGRGANPNDFRAKPDQGVPKKSSGNVSDLYKKREPPKSGGSGSGMYYRF